MALEKIVINPGSYNEFVTKNNLDPADVLGHYSIALTEYKEALAKQKGINLQQLHDGPFSY